MGRNQAGFSLIEVMMALGLSAGLIVWAAQSLPNFVRNRNLMKDRNEWQLMEEYVRLAVNDSAAFANAVKKNSALANCVNDDKVPCPTTVKSVKLYLGEREVTGSFQADNKPCKSQDSKSCPIVISASMRGICEQQPCDVASSVAIDYEITIGGMLYRRGYLQKMVKSDNSSDNNYACPSDEVGNSGFAYALQSGSILCTAPIKAQRKLKNVTPGSCEIGKEVMVGINDDGSVKCESIKWD